MEEIKWNREAFVQQQKQRPRGQGLGVSIGGLIFLVLTIGVLGGGGYWFLKTRGLAPDLPKIDLPAIGGISLSTDKQLDDMEARVAAIEKRLSIAPAKTAKAKPASTARPAVTARNVAASSASSAPAKPAAANAAMPAAAMPSPPADDHADHEAWEATTNRLGMAVGELGEQRREIARTQQSLSRLEQRMTRTEVPFELWKDQGAYRVGPVSLTLQKADSGNQRYNMTIYFDDRRVEMKDRILGERVSLYIERYEEPIELVVSGIFDNRVVGKLSLPAADGRASSLAVAPNP